MGNPGARERSTTWVVGDATYIFGGHGVGSSGAVEDLDDLWGARPLVLADSQDEASTQSAFSMRWTNVAGSELSLAAGTEYSGPPARQGAVGWVDAGLRRAWLFGGMVVDDDAEKGWAILGDTWYFDDSHSSWGYKNGVKWRKCLAGASTGCVAAAGAVPRANAVSWLDTAGTEQGYSAAWIFGGLIKGPEGATPSNDLMYFRLDRMTWTPVTKPNDVVNTQHTIWPSPLQEATSWWDQKNRLAWVFGGTSGGEVDKVTAGGFKSDLWCFSTKLETWTRHTKPRFNPIGGFLSGASAAAWPPARKGASAWFVDGVAFMGHGAGVSSRGRYGLCSDVWRLDVKAEGRDSPIASVAWARSGIAHKGCCPCLPGARTPGDQPPASADSMAWRTTSALMLYGGRAGPEVDDDLDELWTIPVSAVARTTSRGGTPTQEPTYNSYWGAMKHFVTGGGGGGMKHFVTGAKAAKANANAHPTAAPTALPLSSSSDSEGCRGCS